MGNESGDLLLKMAFKGAPIKGASQTVVNPKRALASPLASDFKPGFMTEIDNFTLRIGTLATEQGAKQQTQQTADPQHATHQLSEEERKATLSAVSKPGGYQSWRAGNLKPGRYPLDLQPITFEKPADVASGLLVQACIDRDYFDSAVIIKRKPIGSTAAGEAYLRFEFTNVLVIKVDWTDQDDYVKETVSFIARAITMSYRPQTSAGSLGATIQTDWKM